MEIDKTYTQDDHLRREDDAYAALKYFKTLRIFSSLGIPKTAKILNVGCGAGDFNQQAFEAGYLVDGIEPDANALEIAKHRAPKNVLLENVGLFDFNPKRLYDVIVMHDVLEHIEDDFATIEKIHSLLVPNSKSTLVLSVPAHQWLFGLHDEALGHFRRYSRKSLLSVVLSKFKVMSISSVGFLGIPAALYFSKVRRIPYPVGKPGLSNLILKLSCSVEKVVPAMVGSSLLLTASFNSGTVSK